MLVRSADKIMAFVEESRLQVGDQLPAEVDLAKTLGISRNSVREAYAQLIARGFLVRRHGIGTFLAKPHIPNDFATPRGFWHMIESAGFNPSLRILSRDVWHQDDELTALLTPTAQGRPLRMEWLFYADDVPVIVLEHMISPALRVDHIDWSSVKHLLAVFADQIDPHDAEIEVFNTAVNAPAHVSELLGLPKGAAVLHGLAKIRTTRDTVTIASREWSNPQITGITRRKPLTRMEYDD